MKVYIIQKLIEAESIEDAIKREKEGTIVEIVLSNQRMKKLEPAIGFVYNPIGDEFE